MDRTQIVQAGGLATEVRRGGKGAPLLVIHGELGVPGWLDAFERLSQSHDVIVPSLPGFGATPRPDWIMGIHDVAAWVTWFARDIGINTPVNLVGCSLGGWAAAEIATVAPQFIDKMVLVGPMGLKPREGLIFDYVLESGLTGIKRNFHNPDASAEYGKYYGGTRTLEETDLIEQHREMMCRITWKPWMHSLTLPHLLAAVKTPALILRGAQDTITPPDCAELYRAAIPGAKVETIANCGHAVEMDRPDEFARAVSAFLADARV